MKIPKLRSVRVQQECQFHVPPSHYRQMNLLVSGWLPVQAVVARPFNFLPCGRFDALDAVQLHGLGGQSRDWSGTCRRASICRWRSVEANTHTRVFCVVVDCVPCLAGAPHRHVVGSLGPPPSRDHLLRTRTTTCMTCDSATATADGGPLCTLRLLHAAPRAATSAAFRAPSSRGTFLHFPLPVRLRTEGVQRVCLLLQLDSSSLPACCRNCCKLLLLLLLMLQRI